MIVEISIFVACLAVMLAVPTLLVLMQWRIALQSWVALTALLLGALWLRDIVIPIQDIDDKDAQMVHALLLYITVVFGIGVLQGWGVAWLMNKRALDASPGQNMRG